VRRYGLLNDLWENTYKRLLLDVNDRIKKMLNILVYFDYEIVKLIGAKFMLLIKDVRFSAWIDVP
jgi:hypothetical protein